MRLGLGRPLRFERLGLGDVSRRTTGERKRQRRYDDNERASGSHRFDPVTWVRRLPL